MSIRLENINYIYSPDSAFKKQALKNVSLEIKDGEFIGLIGHTGSGKSTLIQHLNGLIKATSGHIYYNDQDIYDDKFNLRGLRALVGLVFQYPEHQLFEVTVFKDVCFGPKNLGLSQEECEARAREALEMVGLKEKHWQKSPFELSGGQKRRAAIAGVLAMHPEVLILDEPTAGLDPKGRNDILDQVAKLHKESGMTVILVSHSMEDVARYVDRLIVMNRGSVFAQGTPAEVFRHMWSWSALVWQRPSNLRDAPPGSGRLFGDKDATTVQDAVKEILPHSMTAGKEWVTDDPGYYHRTVLSGAVGDPQAGSPGEAGRYCCFFIMIFCINNLAGYVAATAALACLIRLSKVPLKYILKGLKAIFIILIFTAALTCF